MRSIKNFKLNFSLILLLCSTVVFAQSGAVETVSNSNHIIPVGNSTVTLQQNSFSINRDSYQIYSEQIDGKKVFYISENGEFFVIANYGFKEGKEDYFIDYYLFNNQFERITKYREIAPFDLPHPIVSVSDAGFIATFDPLTFKLNIIEQNSNTSSVLLEGVSFEMERAPMIKCLGNQIVVASNVTAMNQSMEDADVNLFLIDKNTNNVVNQKLPLSIVTGIYFSETYLMVSGVIWDVDKVYGKTYEFDSALNQKREFSLNFEKMIKVDDGFFLVSGNRVKKLSNSFDLIREIEIPGFRIFNIISSENQIVINFSAENGNYLSILSQNDLEEVMQPILITENQIWHNIYLTATELYFHDLTKTYKYRLK